MYVVGSDLLAIDLERAVPAGRRHAVSPEGRMLCRPARPRFTWPDQLWGESGADADDCPLCTYVMRAEESFRRAATAPADIAYPVEPQIQRVGAEPTWW